MQPFELNIWQKALELPETQKIVGFIDTTADNFLSVPGADWGFFGLSTEYSGEIVKDIPNEFRRIRRTRTSRANEFQFR